MEYGLYQGNPHAADIAGFCLSLEEQADLETRPVVNIELRDGAGLSAADTETLRSGCRRGVLDHLARVSRDFAASLREDPTTADLRVRVFPSGQGPFSRTGSLKNVYLVKDM